MRRLKLEQSVRQVILDAWFVLPAEQRSLAAVEREVVRRVEQAVEEAGEGSELRSATAHVLAWVAFYLGDLQEAAQQTQRAVDFARDVTDPATRADILALRSFVATGWNSYFS